MSLSSGSEHEETESDFWDADPDEGEPLPGINLVVNDDVRFGPRQAPQTRQNPSNLIPPYTENTPINAALMQTLFPGKAGQPPDTDHKLYARSLTAYGVRQLGDIVEDIDSTVFWTKYVEYVERFHPTMGNAANKMRARFLEHVFVKTAGPPVSCFCYIGSLLPLRSTEKGHVPTVPVYMNKQTVAYNPATMAFYAPGASTLTQWCTMVLGSSGAGKSHFMRYILPASSRRKVCLIMTAAELLGVHATRVGQAPTAPSFYEEPCATLQHVITKAIPPRMFAGAAFVVMIDEAGINPSAYNNMAFLTKLRDAAHSAAPGNVGVHIVVGGTGLEWVPAGKEVVGSNNAEVRKLRMSPWTIDTFQLMFDEGWRSHFRQILVRFPVLAAAVTNPRMARHIFSMLLMQVNPVTASDVVGILTATARSYISQNGLSRTEHFPEVGRGFAAVALRATMHQPSWLLDPKPEAPAGFDWTCLAHGATPSNDFEARARCFALHVGLISTNYDHAVEPSVGAGELAYTITPALLLVCCHLLELPFAFLTCDWSSFEHVGALHNALALAASQVRFSDNPNRVYVLNTFLRQTKLAPVLDAVQIDAWLVGHPNPAALLEFKLFPEQTVYLNGPGAPFADCISPFHLERYKCAARGRSPPKPVDYCTELATTGLLKTKLPATSAAAAMDVEDVPADALGGLAVVPTADQAQIVDQRMSDLHSSEAHQALLAGKY